MANTYTQIHIHAVFAVQNRLSLIQKQWQDELYKYITGIITNYMVKSTQNIFCNTFIINDLQNNK